MGLRYNEEDCKVTGVLSGGPAGSQCKGNEKSITQLFKGKDKENTYCTLRVLCAKTANTGDMKLQAKQIKNLQYTSRYFVDNELIFCGNAANAGCSDS